MAGPQCNKLWDEVKEVYEAAGGPKLHKLVALGEKKPQMAISDSTISEWLSRKSVPSRHHAQYFIRLVTNLQRWAVESGSGDRPRPVGEWQQMLSRAQEERPRGGRPRTTAAATRAGGPVTLPPPPAGFSGRAKPLQEILDWLDPVHPSTFSEHQQPTVVVSVVAGMGGVGKTALALHAAHQAHQRGWFKGGILFADVRGFSADGELEAGAITERFLRALGVKAKDLPPTSEERQDAWHAVLHDLARQERPLLVVLDNVRTAGRIAALLPAPPHRALVTSRKSLSALPAHGIRLPLLETCEAVTLLDQALNAGGVEDDRVTTQPASAQRLAELCGCLPLALMITARLLRDEPQRDLADQADELADARTRLDSLEYDDVDDQGRPLAVRAAFELSYQHLRAPQARAFRLVAAAWGPDISTAAATALIDQRDTRRLLADLARAHLVQPLAQDRWSMHDLLLLFADDHGRALAEHDAREAAVKRLLDYYLATAAAADTHIETRAGAVASDLFRDRDQALAWLDAEHATLIAAATSPAARLHPAGVHLAFALAPFLSYRRHFDDAINLCITAADIYRERGDRHSEGKALNNLGLALREVRRFKDAIEAHRQDLAICRATGDRRGEGTALNNLGLALREAHRPAGAANVHADAYALYRESGDLHNAATALNNLGLALQELHRFEDAIEAHTAAARIFEHTGDRHREGTALTNLGLALRNVGRFQDAITVHEQDLAISREIGDRHGEGQGLYGLGLALQEVGAFEDAVKAHAAAAEIFRETGDRPREAQAMGNLGIALTQAGRFEAAITAHAAAAEIFRETGDQDDERRALEHRSVTQSRRRRQREEGGS